MRPEENAPAVLIVAYLHGEQIPNKKDSQVTCCTMTACHKWHVTQYIVYCRPWGMRMDNSGL